MCHTFLASLQQIFQNPLDAFYMPWYFSCKSHCSCGLVTSHPQDVVVFILNTASPWIIPERLTAPQHTRSILPPFHPTKSSLRCVGGIFLFWEAIPWKFHEPSERDTAPWPHTFCGCVQNEHDHILWMNLNQSTKSMGFTRKIPRHVECVKRVLKNLLKWSKKSMTHLVALGKNTLCESEQTPFSVCGRSFYCRQQQDVAFLTIV